MEHDCDVGKLKIQSSCKGNWSYKRAVSKRSRHNILNKCSFENNLRNDQKSKHIWPGGNPWDAKHWNLQLRWPKMLPRVIFERPQKPLGSALGGPRGSQVGAKSKLGGCFFEVEKARVFQVVFECIFDRFGSPLGSKKRTFRIGGVAKISFSRSCIVTSS